MTENMPPVPPEKDALHQAQLPSKAEAGRPFQAPPVMPGRLSFSRLVVVGFVISCVSIFVFGILGVLGAALSGRGLRATRQGAVRGRGLAIAGMVIGAVGFLYYAINVIVRT